jgi:hypothetical protein
MNTRQRSWSDYVGSYPIESWRGQTPIGDARFYADSWRYGPNSFPEKNDEESTTDSASKKNAETASGRRRSKLSMARAAVETKSGFDYLMT